MKKICKLNELCRIAKGKQINTSLLSEDQPYRYINGGIKESGYYKDYNVSGETVLVSEGGASCGYVNYVNEKFWCGCHCYSLTNCKIPAKYLFYALKANQEKIMQLRTGAAMPNIKKATFVELPLLIDFDSAKQGAVITSLDTIYRSIEIKKEQLLSLDDLVKSRFIEMFGDPLINYMNWERQPLIQNCTICRYLGKIEHFGEKVWLLNLDMITAQTGEIIQKQYVDENAIGNSTVTFSPNYVLYSKLRPYLNKVVVPDTTGYATSELVPLLPNEKINKIFLEYLLRNDSFVNYINSCSGGAKMPRASMDALKQFPLIVPPISLQNVFAEFVKQIDKSKFIVRQQIKDLQELLDSKMDEYFG